MPILLPQRVSLVRRPVPAVPPAPPAKSPGALVRAPRAPQRRPVNRAVPAWVYSLELAGQSIVYFTMFYCSMNWWFYRNQRKDAERDEKDPDP